jgi:hypothetical protein
MTPEVLLDWIVGEEWGALSIRELPTHQVHRAEWQDCSRPNIHQWGPTPTDRLIAVSSLIPSALGKHW